MADIFAYQYFSEFNENCCLPRGMWYTNTRSLFEAIDLILLKQSHAFDALLMLMRCCYHKLEKLVFVLMKFLFSLSIYTIVFETFKTTSKMEF